MTIENKALMIVVTVCFLTLTVLSLHGCQEEQLMPQPTCYSDTEKNIMFIPKGTRIGDIVAPEDGIFIGESRILDLQIIEVPQKDVPKKQKKMRT